MDEFQRYSDRRQWMEWHRDQVASWYRHAWLMYVIGFLTGIGLMLGLHVFDYAMRR